MADVEKTQDVKEEKSSKWLSRKFLMAVSGAVVGVLVAVFPAHEGAIDSTAQVVTGMVVTVLSVLGYLGAESKIDAAREEAAPFEDLDK